VIEYALRRLECPFPLLEEFLHRQLVSIAGWSSYVQYRVRERHTHGQEDHSLVDLLAVRLVYDLAVVAQFESDEAVMGHWRRYQADLQQYEPQTDLLPRYLAQLALEHNYQQSLLAKLTAAPVAEPRAKAKKQLQAVLNTKMTPLRPLALPVFSACPSSTFVLVTVRVLHNAPFCSSRSTGSVRPCRGRPRTKNDCAII
jgi:hypothetical protein